jgi:hypothetical protein
METQRYEYVLAGVGDLNRLGAKGYRAAHFTGGDVVMERPVRRPAFFAELALMGHRELGLCRVEESSLCGREMLRVTALEGDEVHWIAPGSIYDLREVSEAEAERRLAGITAEREREMRVQAERAERRQGTVATLTRRDGHQTRVTWRDAGGVEWRAWSESEVETAVTECGHLASVWSYRQGVEIGASEAVVIEALAHLGCTVGEVIDQTSGDSPIVGADDCDHEGEF